jgi:hypothetical protein
MSELSSHSRARPDQAGLFLREAALHEEQPPKAPSQSPCIGESNCELHAESRDSPTRDRHMPETNRARRNPNCYARALRDKYSLLEAVIDRDTDAQVQLVFVSAKVYF